MKHSIVFPNARFFIVLLKYFNQYSRGNVDINHFVNGLGTISCIEDDLGGQGGPLQDMLGVSEDASDDVGSIGAKLFLEIGVVENLDVGSEIVIQPVISKTSPSKLALLFPK